MIVVKVFGGLGNQMFQYMLYRKFVSLGNEAKLDILYYDWMKRQQEKRRPGIYNHNSDFVLGRVLNIEENYMSPEEAREYRFTGMDSFSRTLRKLKLCGGDYYRWKDENVGSLYQPEFLSKRDGYFEGYWTCFRYAEGIENTLRKEFTFLPPLNAENQALLDQIRQTPSVSIHVRRSTLR